MENEHPFEMFLWGLLIGCLATVFIGYSVWYVWLGRPCG